MKRVIWVAAVAVLLAAPVERALAWGGMFPVMAHDSQGYLGVGIRDVSDERAKELKLKDAGGAEITMLDHDGPAMKAGLKMGDVIVQMNGQAIVGEEQLRRMLRETPAGRTVSFVVSRDGQTLTISAQLADRGEVARRAWEQHFAVPEPPDEPTGVPDPMEQGGPMPVAPRGYPGFGFTAPPIVGSTYTGAAVDEMGPQLADYFGVKGGAGLLVKSVDGESPAAKAGLRAGDVVVRVNGDAMTSRLDWIRVVQHNHGKTLTLNVVRDKQEQTLTLALNGKH